MITCPNCDKIDKENMQVYNDNLPVMTMASKAILNQYRIYIKSSACTSRLYKYSIDIIVTVYHIMYISLSARQVSYVKSYRG